MEFYKMKRLDISKGRISEMKNKFRYIIYNMV